MRFVGANTMIIAGLLQPLPEALAGKLGRITERCEVNALCFMPAGDVS
ncbi:hypothetical protein [Morganella morganii IS15]|nr:hypothetical protein CSB69_1157 [Morganella morganii]CDK66813.1 hypothetical protein [Morganella morganii IS15]